MGTQRRYLITPGTASRYGADIGASLRNGVGNSFSGIAFFL